MAHGEQFSMSKCATYLTLILLIAIGMTPSAFAQTTTLSAVDKASIAALNEGSAGAATYEAKDYASAAKHYAAACAGGNAASCFYLGQMDEDGVGVPQDKSKAVALYSKACAAGYPSCFNAAVLYYQGEGVPQDRLKAAALFDEACSIGNANGCAVLGLMYLAGNGVIQNKPKAVALFVKGCAGGSGNGCLNLGNLYAKGDGVPQNYDSAIVLYKRALEIDPNDVDAKKNLGLADGLRKK
ncbi:tetratricopeptide repeat protein [Sphingomonas sp. RT2P30]|uniref:tetratricopeptide repeat protein n=1 Tax=Parasphingomonas halimpatiens TaxID=3096162 RepID=UPI002FCC41F6